MVVLAERSTTPAAAYRPPGVYRVPTEARRHNELTKVGLYLAERAGLELDYWQRVYLAESLRQRPSGEWAAVQCCLCVPRQNGKGSILEARELVALFIDDDRWPGAASRLTIHTAHEALTSSEAFGRLWGLIVDTPALASMVRGQPVTAPGRQEIRLRNGRRIQFRTRTKSGGRGYSADLLAFDEAMILAERQHAASFSSTTARPNSQIWYTGSAPGDPTLLDKATVFSRLRQRGLAGDEDLIWVEYSLGEGDPDRITAEQAAELQNWYDVNPSLGLRLSERLIAVEQKSLDTRGFAAERLGVVLWPRTDKDEWVIPRGRWESLGDPDAVPLDPVAFAFDVSPLRTYSAVAVAGRDADGNFVVEILKAEAGTDWLVPFILERHKKNRRAPWVYEAAGPAASMAPQLENERVNALPITGGQYAAACGAICDAASAGLLRHRNDRKLTDAVMVTTTRKVGDRFAWGRKQSTGDITSFVAATLAFGTVQGLMEHSSMVVDPNELLADEQESSAFDVANLPPL